VRIDGRRSLDLWRNSLLSSVVVVPHPFKSKAGPISAAVRPALSHKVVSLLRDPKDEFVLELAVEGGCDLIITYNQRDFSGVERFGLRTMTPRDFLRLIEGVP
jgi:predicted nucleic acid-binding protein